MSVNITLPTLHHARLRHTFSSLTGCMWLHCMVGVCQNGTKASIDALVQKLNANKVPQSVGQSSTTHTQHREGPRERKNM